MSDLETPEADMMRDQGSVDAARATLRPEESRPGLDPDNPGAAPDITLDLMAWHARRCESTCNAEGTQPALDRFLCPRSGEPAAGPCRDYGCAASRTPPGPISPE